MDVSVDDADYKDHCSRELLPVVPSNLLERLSQLQVFFEQVEGGPANLEVYLAGLVD
jgi:hypothetical protein